MRRRQCQQLRSFTTRLHKSRRGFRINVQRFLQHTSPSVRAGYSAARKPAYQCCDTTLEFAANSPVRALILLGRPASSEDGGRGPFSQICIVLLAAAVKSPYCRSRKPFEIRAGAVAGNERVREGGTAKIEIVLNLLSPGRQSRVAVAGLAAQRPPNPKVESEILK